MYFSASFSLLGFHLYLFIPKAEWEVKIVDGERKEEIKISKKRELHELQYTKIVKFGTIKFASAV